MNMLTPLQMRQPLQEIRLLRLMDSAVRAPLQLKKTVPQLPPQIIIMQRKRAIFSQRTEPMKLLQQTAISPQVKPFRSLLQKKKQEHLYTPIRVIIILSKKHMALRP